MSAGVMNLGLGDTSGASGFDAAAYLAANPDLQAIVQKFPHFDLAQHYAQYGKAEGRPLRPAASQPPPTPDAAAQPSDSATFRLDPSDPASWAAYKRTAQNQTAGINRLPGMAPTTDKLPADASAVLSLFRAASAAPAAQGPAAAPVSNLGLGTPFNGIS